MDFWSSIPGIGLGRGDDRRALEMFIARNPGTCLVMRENGMLAGTVMAGFDGRRGYIYHLAVHPQYQGQGYGQALLEKVITELENLGAQKIHLFVFSHNHQAIEFYRRLGWRERNDIQVMSWETSQTTG
ncbi:MAG: GNAT family N-acetyltransferase [Syntrophothermaceae bacterium]